MCIDNIRACYRCIKLTVRITIQNILRKVTKLLSHILFTAIMLKCWWSESPVHNDVGNDVHKELGECFPVLKVCRTWVKSRLDDYFMDQKYYCMDGPIERLLVPPFNRVH